MSKAVIFDLDGTLIDSLGDIHAALNDVLQLRNAPPLALATVRGFIGKGSANLVMRALTTQNLPNIDAENRPRQRRKMPHHLANSVPLGRA